MNEEQKALMARVLDMNERELRAALLTTVKDAYEVPMHFECRTIIKINIDNAFNPTRRTGAKPFPKEI